MDMISRRYFLIRTTQLLVLSSVSSLTAACSLIPRATVPEVPPPILGRESMALKSITDVTQIAKLLGEGSINDTPGKYGLYGADLGSMFDMGGRLYMVFGDSFGCCIPGTGGPGTAPNLAEDWRCNTMAVISDRGPGNGLTFDTMIMDKPGHAGELLHKSIWDASVIPTYGVAIGDRMFLHYMAVKHWGGHGQWNLSKSGLAYSDDKGQSWKYADNFKWDGDSNFGQVSIVKMEKDLYFFGIPGGRSGGVKLAKVGQETILDKGAYQYFTGLIDCRPQWQGDESAAVLIVPAPVGELSVMWNAWLNRWIMTCPDQKRKAIVIREAPDVWGPWSEPVVLVSGREFTGGIYGAYMHPWYTENNGETIYFAMSKWRDYSVFWMRARLEKHEGNHE